MDRWTCRACGRANVLVDVWDVCNACRDEFVSALWAVERRFAREVGRAAHDMLIAEASGEPVLARRLAREASVASDIAVRARELAVTSGGIR